jgi:hypothetical protein
MKAFISWSGDYSKKIAAELSDWLPKLIQAIKPFYSPNDIGIGNRWFSEVETILRDAHWGILCLTAENINSPWIMFEAGALSKNIGQSRVMPLLFGINYADISGPLAQFQAVKFNKEDFFRLIQSINDMPENSSLPHNVLAETFEKWWPDLEKKVTGILSDYGNIKAVAKQRSGEDILDEVLDRVRHLNNEMQLRKLTVHPDATKELIGYYIDFCNGLELAINNPESKFEYYYISIGRIRLIEKAFQHLLDNTETSTDEFTVLKKEFKKAKEKAKYIFDILLPKILRS